MSDVTQRCLEAFPRWLATLVDDVRALEPLAYDTTLPEGVRFRVAAALNYALWMDDVAPDDLAELTHLDLALVVRTCARAASDALVDAPAPGPLARLASDAELARAFLDRDHARLVRFADTFTERRVRGRTVEAIGTDPDVQAELGPELAAWAHAHGATLAALTPIGRDDKRLIRFAAYLAARLPD
jgi:hypothetical protein